MTTETLYDVLLAEFDAPEHGLPERYDEPSPFANEFDDAADERPRIDFRTTLSVLKRQIEEAGDRIAKEAVELELAAYKDAGRMLLTIAEGGKAAQVAAGLLTDNLMGNRHLAAQVIAVCTDNPAFRRHPSVRYIMRLANAMLLGKPLPAAPPPPERKPRVFRPDELAEHSNGNLAVMHLPRSTKERKGFPYFWRHTVVAVIDGTMGEHVVADGKGILPNVCADPGMHRTGGDYNKAEYNPQYHLALRNAVEGSPLYDDLEQLAKAVNKGRNVVIIGSEETEQGWIVATEILRHAKILRNKPHQDAKRAAAEAKIAGPSCRYDGYEDMDEIRRQMREEQEPLTTGRRIYDPETVKAWGLGGICVPGSEESFDDGITIRRQNMYMTPKGEMGYCVKEFDDYLRLVMVDGPSAGEADEWPRTKLRRMYVLSEFEKQHVDTRTGEVLVEKSSTSRRWARASRKWSSRPCAPTTPPWQRSATGRSGPRLPVRWSAPSTPPTEPRRTP